MQRRPSYPRKKGEPARWGRSQSSGPPNLDVDQSRGRGSRTGGPVTIETKKKDLVHGSKPDAEGVPQRRQILPLGTRRAMEKRPPLLRPCYSSGGGPAVERKMESPSLKSAVKHTSV